ncbi:APC family permease [Pseudonocardia nigra]|uniref:APC family permease n=1 Tax=Pseudonocardia nigra TaxID=1921578 RepID=UPI001C5F919F|nr:APC family permease [Pseudonocardia nigra]
MNESPNGPDPTAAAPPSRSPVTAAYDGELTRSLGVGGNVLITLSSISPASSVFILGGAALALFGTGVFWAFLIAGVVSILVAFCYAELAAAHPVAGGDYSLVSRALGPAAGVAVFVISLVSLPLIIAVFALGVADYLGVVVAGLSTVHTAIVVVALTTVVACFNIRANAWVTGVFLVVEMAALVLLTALGLLHVERPVSSLFTPQALDAGSGSLAPLALAGLMVAVTQGIFAYNGYGGAVYFAEETRNASRAVAKAVIWSAAVTVLSEIIPLTAIILGASSLAGLFGAELPVESFLSERAGQAISLIVLLAIAFAIINAVIAITLQAGRLLYSAARDRALPDAVATPLRRVSRASRVPVVATAVMGVLALVACLVPLDVLLTATGSTLSFSYLFIALAALAHRRSDRHRTDRAGYRMPWWPLPPLLVVVALLVVFVVSLADPTQHLSLAVASGFVVLGFAYYLGY